MSFPDISEAPAFLPEVFAHWSEVSAKELVQEVVEEGSAYSTVSGGCIPGASKIRDWFYERGHSLAVANGFMISVPHTHWDPSAPMVISQMGDHFKIGNQPLLKGGRYRPVSFAFRESGVYPYEWVDESVEIDEADYEEALAIISAIRETMIAANPKLGICLNFRFKKLFSEAVSATFESTDSGSEYEDAGTIRRSPEAAIVMDGYDFEIVQWHCISDKYSDLSDSAIDARNEIEALIYAERSPVERNRIINEVFASF
ncbi:hypothetical protein [Rhizobium redzepovicii]